MLRGPGTTPADGSEEKRRESGTRKAEPTDHLEDETGYELSGCSKRWPFVGRTRASEFSDKTFSGFIVERLESRISMAPTRSPPQPFRMSSRTAGLWAGKIFFRTSSGGRLALRLKGRDTEPERPSMRMLGSGEYLGLSALGSGSVQDLDRLKRDSSSWGLGSEVSGVQHRLGLDSSGELAGSGSLSLALPPFSPPDCSPDKSSFRSGKNTHEHQPHEHYNFIQSK